MQNGLTTYSVNVDVQLESTVRGFNRSTNVNLWTHREQCNLRNKDDNV